MSVGRWSRTRRHQQRFDVVWVEDSEQVVKGPDEPAAAVREHLHQLLGLQETFFCALHLRKEVSQHPETSTYTLPALAENKHLNIFSGMLFTQNLLFTGS